MKQVMLFLTLIFCQNLSASPVIIISDIDDTIKDSNVLDGILGGAHMSKTFTGLSNLYGYFLCNSETSQAKKTFCFENMGAVHSPNRWVNYVTGTPSAKGPIAIGQVARSFIYNAKFPNGIVFTRPSTKVDTKEFKIKKISKIIDGVKNDKFRVILIGDNGEHDPEAFKIIVEKYSKQNVEIYSFLHQVYSTDPEADEQGANLHKGQIPYLTASDLALQFYQLGLIDLKHITTINKLVLKDIQSNKKKIRRKVLPKWVRCNEFVKEYIRPQIKLNTNIDNQLSSIEQEINKVCSSRDIN